MSDVTLALVLAAALGAAFAAIAAAAVYHYRVLTARRLHALEEALRVYNNASAALGRRLLCVESQLEQERRQAAPPAEVHAARTRRAPPDEGFSDAELRLSQLIKSRLAELRLN